ncbi:uncharacterized protein LOC134212761 isoform X2 [Armigeres subalbatus]
MKNSEMNRAFNQNKFHVDNSVDSEWDLSQIELQEEQNSGSIPTIELEDDDEVDVGCGPPTLTQRVRNIPIRVERSVSPAHTVSPTPPAESTMVRRTIHDHRTHLPSSTNTQAEHEQQRVTVLPTPAGIILNRVYHKNPTAHKDNYFSFQDTPPSPGALPASVIFGDRPTSAEPKIVMTANHYDKRIVRRSFDKSCTATSTKTSRQQKNSGPYRLLGVIDLEPDTESETTESCSQSVSGDEPTSVESSKHRDIRTPTNSALLGSSTRSNESPRVEDNNPLTIEIDEDDIEEDTRMELSDEEGAIDLQTVNEDQPLPGTSKDCSNSNLPIDQCTLKDSDSSSTAQVNPSSMANSFWDVSSSGCVKIPSENKVSSSANRPYKYTEFDAMLEKINQQVPAMSQQDRVEHWRVTKEDLLYSIPTVAEIESTTSVKRHMDEAIHISSSESSSDSETSDSPSLLRERQLREKYKKRRMAVDSTDPANPALPVSKDLDFRRSQLNPEIDKTPCSMIQIRKHYYKFPTRFDPTLEEKHELSSGVPYASFLHDEKERNKCKEYLRYNPAYCPDLKPRSRHLPVGVENKVAVVVISPLKITTTEGDNGVEIAVNNSKTIIRQQPDLLVERPKSADRVSHYGKIRSRGAPPSVVARKRRYKVHSAQQKRKKSIMVVTSSNLRSYRRLVLKAGYSLRNGKVRKKQSFVNLKQNRRPKRKLEPSHKADRQMGAASDSTTAPIRRNSRVSVDSAVSSSTSAERQNNHTQRPAAAVGGVPEVAKLPLPSELRTIKNPVDRANGEVQMVYYAADTIIVIQQDLISFWECSKLASLLGLQQELQPLGQMKRAQTDTIVDSTNFNRLCFNEGEVIYLEPRARNLDEDDARLCPLASLYINCYFVGANEEKETPSLRMKSLQLDSVRSEISDILFTPLPRSRYFIICWHELLAENEHRTGMCKYSLTPDLETLASIREFPTVTQKIASLKCLDGNRLIGLGSTTVAIWNYDNGCLVFTVDLKVEIQTPLAAFIYNEKEDSALFLIQLCPSAGENLMRKTIKIMAINMKKRSWHLVQNYDIPLESSSILTESSTLHEVGLHCTTFQSGELLAISLDDLTTCFTNHKQLQGPDGRRITRDKVAMREKLFLNAANGRQLVLVSDKSIKLRTIDEYALACR